MSRPLKKQTHSGATSTGASEPWASKGHNSLGVQVTANNLDQSNDTLSVRLEVAPDSSGPWTTIDTRSGGNVNTRLVIAANDMDDVDGDGNYGGFLYAHGVPAPYIRVNITEFTDDSGGDLAVDTYVYATNNANGNGHSFD